MKKAFLFILSFLFLSSLMFSQNLMTNDDLETWTNSTTPTSWDKTESITQESVTIHGGTYSAKQQAGTKDLMQNVSGITGGQTYTIKYYYLDNDALARTRMWSYWLNGTSTISDNAAELRPGTYSSDNPLWQEYSVTIVAPATADGIRIEVRSYNVDAGGGYIFFDDFSVVAETTGALTISNVSREYPVPTDEQNCRVECDITGGTPSYVPSIIYNIDGNPQSAAMMVNITIPVHAIGIIPVQNDGTRVEYSIEVTDSGADATEISSTYGLFWGTSDISTAAGDIKEVDGNGVLVYDGYYARVTGVATVATGVFSSSNLDVYFQDSVGGINIFKYAAGAITEGNEYTVFGVIDQYNGKAEIVPNDASTDITDNGISVVPDPIVLTVAELLADPETYEGMLIGIQHLDKVSGTWGANENLIMTDDNSINTIILRIDGDTDLDENIQPLWPKDVQGIIGQYDDSSPYNSGYQIFPRRYTDILGDGALPVNLSSFYALYIGGTPTLYWTTQTETENSYWNVYRGTNDTFDQAMWLNANDPVPGNGTINTASDYIYEDTATVVQNTTYWYWIEDVSTDGETEVHEPITLTIPFEDIPIIPDTYGLHQNYPNPFNPSTSISFALEEANDVELIIYNIKGAKIRTIFNDHIYADQITSAVWDGKDAAGKQVSSGVYFYKLITETKEYSRKMLLVK